MFGVYFPLLIFLPPSSFLNSSERAGQICPQGFALLSFTFFSLPLLQKEVLSICDFKLCNWWNISQDLRSYSGKIILLSIKSWDEGVGRRGGGEQGGVDRTQIQPAIAINYSPTIYTGKFFLTSPLPCRGVMELRVLWDMKAEAQCGRQLHPHPQDREEWDSDIPENNVWWWSQCCRGAVDRRTIPGHSSVQLGRLSCPLAAAAGGDPRNPQPCSPISLPAFAFTSPCSGYYPVFPTLADTHVPVHINITVAWYFIICITVAPAWSWQFQPLYWGFLMADHSKKEFHKSCVFVMKTWKQRISNSQNCLGMRELN